MRLLSGEAMVAPLAERLDIPYPATDKSCGRVETSKDEGVGGLPDKETCWRRRWGGKEQGSRSQAAGNCRSQRRDSRYLGNDLLHFCFGHLE